MIEENKKVMAVLDTSDLREIVFSLLDAWENRRAEEAEVDEVVPKHEANSLPNMGKSEATLMRWDKSGYLPKVRIGRKIGYRKSDLKKIGAL
jgi:hypothetical protein